MIIDFNIFNEKKKLDEKKNRRTLVSKAGGTERLIYLTKELSFLEYRWWISNIVRKGIKTLIFLICN